MSSTAAAPPVNSRSWWEDYFASQWDADNGRAQTTYFMQRLVENLPAPEREFLASQEATVLDWGCAFGDGVDVLAKAFPRCRAAGLEFAQRAVAEAKQYFSAYEFLHAENGEIGAPFDVIVTSNRLEHFAEPVRIMRQHLRSCRGFYVVLVPYREAPLGPGHASQFREECFPEQLDGFARIAVVVVDCDACRGWGQMILAVYGSPGYVGQRRHYALRAAERQKWDDYYAMLSPQEMDNSVRRFGEELAAELYELLPEGSSVLEAGCGAGWQSMILAESKRLRVTLMDFAPAAVRFARQSFQERGLSAEFLCEDVFASGKEEHDLVFNAGVLEHYTFDEQVAFLRGMASRSRKYVLALVPNRHCYWYWIWRIYNVGQADWPYGKEAPMGDLSAAFEAAGLTFLGEWFGGGAWSEDFIARLPGLSEELREYVLAVHRSGVIPLREQGYLLAALGCKGEAPSVPVRWCKPAQPESFAANESATAFADALALTIAAQQRCKKLEQQLHTSEGVAAALREELRSQVSLCEELRRQAAFCEELRGQAALCEELSRQAAVREELLRQATAAAGELAALKGSRGYRLLRALWRVRRWLAPPGGLRAGLARNGWQALHGAAHFPVRRTARSVFSAARRQLQRLGNRLAPLGTARGRWARTALRRVHRLHAGRAGCSSLSLEEILEETEDRKGIVVYPPFIDWTWMRQRPHQLMAQFAKAGYLSLFCSPKRRTDNFQGFVRAAKGLYLCDSLKPLLDIPNCLLLVGWSGWESVKQFRSPLTIYDYLDDLGVAESWASEEYKLEMHRKLVTYSQVVLSTARRLHAEVKKSRPDALYCPNGVDYEHFHLAAAPPPPPDIADLVAAGRPIIGYYGALARWFDYELLAHAAKTRKDCEFLLIGPNFDGTLGAESALDLPNVRWLGEKKYEELPAYLHYFTVATIPFQINDITKATSPVKLFEYMAGGKPIVTTAIPECCQYSCVLVAHDPAEYVAQLDEAIHRGGSETYLRLLDEEARNNTWENRIRQIIAQLDAFGASEQLRSA